ncbi:MAG: (2Fe-2S)-binding domain protein [Hyphomicrobiales bacterium]|nr:(2Fe-2S)-binding domain protein [Hyphomicrobiales bacterium]
MSTSRTIQFTLNGRPATADISASETIVDMLTNRFELRGARESCGQGLCGCCTVTVDGMAVSGCLSLAWFLDGKRVETVEALSKGGVLDPVQEAFIEAGAFQCGFCTPGFIMMVRQLLDAHPDPDEEEVRHYLTGNLCRCSAYPEIMDAVKLAAAKRKKASAG